MPASARGMWRASANSSEIACSAAASVLPSGAFITAMPRCGGGLDVDGVDAGAGAADHLSLLGVAPAPRAVTWVAERTSNGVDTVKRARQLRQGP